MTSPARISARCSDSSNRAAKDSDIEVCGLLRGVRVDDPRHRCAAARRSWLGHSDASLRWSSLRSPTHYECKQSLYLGAKDCLSPHHLRTCATDSSTDWLELSRRRASSAGLRGATARFESRAS